MRCKNCKYWEGFGILGDCSSPKWLRGYHITDEEISSDDVLVEDDEGWGMHSAPEFGCVHFMEKDENNSPKQK